MNKNLMYALVSILFISCEQILEEDIQKKEVELIIPANGIRLSMQNVGFLWEGIDGAESYRLQIVNPDFTVPQTLVLDTLIHKKSFRQYLDLGKYEWRVRAENSAYQSDFTTYVFWVDTLNSSRISK
ncbi:MAG: hypothetical protein RLN79_08430 [Cytophagales bacterium]